MPLRVAPCVLRGICSGANLWLCSAVRWRRARLWRGRSKRENSPHRAFVTFRPRRYGALAPGISARTVRSRWVEGKNIAIEYRYSDGRNDRLPQLIGDLVRLKVDIIVTAVTNDTLAAKNAAGGIPIVMAAAGDPVATGIVASLARPGGNITGLSQMNPELNGKRLELLKEIAPDISSLPCF